MRAGCSSAVALRARTRRAGSDRLRYASSVKYRIALAQVRPQRLAHPPTVMGDDRVGDAEDRLRRAVVLLQPHHLGVGVVVAEREDISDIGSAEAVDRVVSDKASSDEVVRPFDVEVIDRPVELDALDRLDHVVGTVLGEHRHPRSYARGVHERERVGSARLAPAETCTAPLGGASRVGDLAHCCHSSRHRRKSRLESPALTPTPRLKDAIAEVFKPSANKGLRSTLLTVISPRRNVNSSSPTPPATSSIRATW